MKKLFLFVCLFASFAAPDRAQAVRVDPAAATTIAATSPSSFVKPPLLALPFANVSVCAYPANGAPCTNYATTYTDPSEATACPTTSQIVLAGTTTCTSTADGQGNFGVWIPAGLYSYTVAYGGIAYGPYPLSAGFNPSGSIVSTVANPPAFAYTPVGYTPMMSALDNTVFPAPIETTLGTLSSPSTSATPSIFCQVVGSTTANHDLGDPSGAPACLKAYSIATDAGATSNVVSLMGVSQTNNGCRVGGSGACTSNSTGGIAVGGFASLNTANAVTWGGWFTADDRGFAGGITGIEADLFAAAARSAEGQYRGVQSVDVDESGGTQSVQHDWGFYSAGFGKGFVYGSGGLPGNNFNAFYIEAGTTAGNAGTTVLGFASGQPGPFEVGLDFTNATFSDAAIKNASIKQPQILTGVTNGSGAEHLSACSGGCTVTATPCTTSGAAGATCTNALTLPVAMADSAFQASCSGVAIASGVPILYVSGKTSTTLTVGTQAATASAAAFGEIDCHITHN